MSRDDETSGVNPGDKDNQGDRGFNPDDLPGDASSLGDSNRRGGGGSRDDDGYERGAGSDRGEPGGTSRRYQPTNHPEDAPGGFTPGYGAPGGTAPGGYGSAGGSEHSGYQPYPGTAGNAGYPGSGAYANAYGGYSAGGFANGGGSQPGGQAVESTDGKVDIVRAVRFGFRSVFANPAIWILGTVVVGLVFIVLSIILGFLVAAIDPAAVMEGDPLAPANIVLNLVMSVLSWAIAICVMRGALIETDGRKATLSDFFHPKNVGQTVFLLFIFTVVGLVAGTLIQTATNEMFIIDEASGTIAVNESAFGRIMIFMVIATLLNPLYTYWVYYTSDGRENAVGAATHGFTDAVRNYPKLLLFSVVGTIVILVLGMVTLLLGFIILLPASMLIAAHLYRQMSGGDVPVDAHR